MKMEQRKFRIGELAQMLGVEPFVIRFWEKEFRLKSTRSHGGQRFYSEKDLAMFSQIKQLLYDKGFTIAGAKKQLLDKQITGAEKITPIIASQKTTLKKESALVNETEKQKQTLDQIVHLQSELIKLRNLL